MHNAALRKGITTLVFLTLLILVSMQVSPVLAGTAAISGSVFQDQNDNGLRDPGEGGLEGAEITLIAISGDTQRIISQAMTNAEGYYSFAGLEAGEYALQGVLPGPYTYSAPVTGGSAMLPSSGKESRTPVFTLGQDEQADKPVGASRRSAYINLIAFGDTNMNGGRMSNEPLLRDVQVDLVFEYDGKFYVVAQGRTNKDGELQLRDLTPGTYRIAVTMPEPYIIGPLGQKINPFYNVVPPGDNNRGISEPFQLERSLGLGIGGVKAGTLKGRIWLDSNMNGAMDAGEGGFPGILLTLTHQALGVVRELTSGDSAEFAFEYLQAGEYFLKADLPQGVMFGLPGSPSLFQDGYTGSQEISLRVYEDGASQVEPIGIMPASGIRVAAFHDSNVNGVWDDGEPAFSGAVVEALADGVVKATATSDSQGIAELPRIRQGEVGVRVQLPDGQVFTVDGGSDGNRFYSQAATSDATIQVSLQAGEQLTLQAGATLPSSISGQLFDDSNLSGVLDAGEQGLTGFTVQAIDTQGQVAKETQTDASGAYRLDGLVPASYRIRFLLISPYVFSDPSQAGTGIENDVTEQSPEYGLTAPVSLSAGMLAENIDGGAFRSALISGSVLLGDDILGFTGQNGGLENVYIELLDEGGQPVSGHTNARTGADGSFSLKGALPGSYTLSFTLPDNAKFSLPLTDQPSVQSDVLQVKASDEVTLQPLYAVKTGIVSGIAMEDVNNNASLDEGDLRLAGVSLRLVNAMSGEVYETASDDQGVYQLSGIRPGAYQASITLPDGFALDANENSLVPPSVDGTSSADLDIGMGGRLEGGLIAALKPIHITGKAFYDNDMDGKPSPADTPYPLQLSLTHVRSGLLYALTADPEGGFASGNVLPGTYQVVFNLPADHVLLQADGFVNQQNVWSSEMVFGAGSEQVDFAIAQLGSLSGSVWNMDGSGKDIAGIPVNLLDESGKVLAEAVSDEQGGFRFADLLPGRYRIEAQLLEPYRFSRLVDTANRPSVITSDLVGADNSSGSSEAITLTMGEHKTAQDIGIGALGKLGDYAWLDLDMDGMQDAGEPGIPGIPIKLVQYGQVSAETVTDAYGRYLFTKLFPGTYTLQIEMPAEIKPTIRQTLFPLVGSILIAGEGNLATAEGVVVPSGGRNLNADLGFVLLKEGRYPASMDNLPVKDWTRVNEQQPKR